MSRHEIYDNNHGMAFGWDHTELIAGFIQVWKTDPAYPPNSYENQPDPENMLIDEDGIRDPDKFKDRIREVAAKYNIKLPSFY